MSRNTGSTTWRLRWFGCRRHQFPPPQAQPQMALPPQMTHPTSTTSLRLPLNHQLDYYHSLPFLSMPIPQWSRHSELRKIRSCLLKSRGAEDCLKARAELKLFGRKLDLSNLISKNLNSKQTLKLQFSSDLRDSIFFN